MPLSREHDLHSARSGRNLVVGACLCAFVLLVFALTLVKLSSGHQMEAFDHSVRPSLVKGDQ
ncbi:MAG: hypothetical protein OXB95_05840 [Rhodobacteraceae bacterium]|nr:hypothetical protein [Paracoccaceae bacterium]